MSPLLILGASTRAAAFSAIRSGFDPICGDMFADADLRRWSAIVDVPRYPHGLADAVKHLEPMPFIYTGALENWPGEIQRVGQRHFLWGNGSERLKLCRDPWFCRDVLQRAGIPTLDLRSSTNPPPGDGNWMLKPLRSSAGRAVTVWNDTATAVHEPHYFQQRMRGTPISAACLAFPEHVELLGISKQLIGFPELNAPEFGYCGSVFPWNCDLAVQYLVHKMGSVLADECGLQGLFGIDLIHDGKSVWLIEVNPRYTASMELIEYCHHQASLHWHQVTGVGTSRDQLLRQLGDLTNAATSPYRTDAVILHDSQLPRVRPYSDRPRNQAVDSWDAPNKFAAKVILYADRPAKAPDLSHRIPRTIELGTLPELADIPVDGTDIVPGQPVFTCLGRGQDPDMLVAELIAKAHDIWARFKS